MIKFNSKQVAFIKKAYRFLTAKQIARELDCSSNSVVRCVAKNGLKKNHRWTKKEVAFLRVNYRKKPVVEIARSLNLRYTQIESKAASLGLKKQKPRLFNKYNESILKANYGKKTILEISKLIGIDERRIIRRIWYLRLTDPFWKTTKRPEYTSSSRIINNKIRFGL